MISLKNTLKSLGETTPPGVIQAYAGSTIPPGWIECNGQALSRTTYSNLFAAIGTTYGSGDGSTTFNVPNLKGRVVVGEDDDSYYWEYVCTENSTFTVSETAEYRFGIDTRWVTKQFAAGTYTANVSTFGSDPASGTVKYVYKKTVLSHGKEGGEFSHTLKTPEMPSHNHRFYSQTYGWDLDYIPAMVDSASGNNIGSSPYHAYISGYGIYMRNTGGNTAHSNMQPYLTVKYIIWGGYTV